MPHPAQHEERILRHALADPGLAEAERGGLAAQVGGCSECLAFGYRALADLPSLLAAAGLPAGVANRWSDRAAGRLEALLASAVEPAPGAEAPRRALPGFLGALLLPRLAPSTALALTLVLLVSAGPPFLRRPTVGPSFARAQLQFVLEALPPGYGFVSAPPSPFWRGYSLGLLEDLEAAGLRPEEATAVRSVLLRASGDPQGERPLLVRGCGSLEGGNVDRRECRYGAWAYRVQRTLAEGRDASSLLGSEDGVDFLAWARRDGGGPEPGAPALPADGDGWAALVEVLLQER